MAGRPEGSVEDRDERGLTVREREVLEGHEQGLTQVEMAERFGVTKQAVNVVVRRLRERGWIK